MKAILCNQFGLPDDLMVAEIDPVENPGDGEVVIEVRAAGVNFPDTLIIQGKYQFQPEFPFTPGGEVAGVIKVVGPQVSGFEVGDRVIAGTGWGAFAEEVKAPVTNVHKLPDEIDFITGATIAEAYGTSYHALADRAQLKPGETLLVLGSAGGVGIAAVQLGKTMGAHVIAAASTTEKLDFAKKCGADETINYSEEDLKSRAKELTGGRGVDVIYDPVGGPLTEAALRAVAWNGRHLVVGFAMGEIPKLPLNLPLLKGCSVVGVFWGGFFRKELKKNHQNFQKILDLVSDGQFSPPIHRVFSLDNTAEALKEIMERKVMGKIVLDVANV